MGTPDDDDVQAVQLATPPGFSNEPHPEGEPCTWYNIILHSARVAFCCLVA